ncbi:hypothetical protein QE177_11510 [Arsenophonus sp. aPb]|uniref:hypothetical protein n=1 Tax=Arsenophonus sp. aPb TaxID=3041619 RepID=UPI002468B7CD|nr:hypothetical protein [Arsenophonus sp. aPb]WGL97817.1 hypothetical protein QE177_11510 [Arsenophonus sp. aPb]
MGVIKSCEVRIKYLQIYQAAFDEVVATYDEIGVLSDVKLRLSPIDEIALSSWSSDWMGKSSKHKHGKWDWKKIVTKRLKRCKKFDLAIWGNGILCGLSLGMVSKGKKTIRMDFLQACPVKHPLEKQIAEIAVAIAAGQRVGAEHVAIFNPINKDVENHYKKLGFVRKKIYNRYLRNVMYKAIPSKS